MANSTRIVVWLGVLFLASIRTFGEDASFTALENPEREVRAMSGTTIYTEAIVDTRWLTRCRATDGRIHFANERWDDTNSFSIHLQRSPQSSPEQLGRGWRWVRGSERGGESDTRKHFTVELLHEDAAVAVNVNTALDGTPVMERWLEIRNDGDRPVAITGLSVWSGRLWRQQQQFSLGYFTRDTPGSQGWLEWEELAPGRKEIRGGTRRGHDDPFFIVRNDE